MVNSHVMISVDDETREESVQVTGMLISTTPKTRERRGRSYYLRLLQVLGWNM